MCEQSVFNGFICDFFRQEGVLGEKDMIIIVLMLVWLDSKSWGVWDYYWEGMVMECWDLENWMYDCFVIDWVIVSSNMLILKDWDGVCLDLKVFVVDSQWMLFWVEILLVVEGECLVVFGKILDICLKGGESIMVMKVEEGQLMVQWLGQKIMQILVVGVGVFDGIKIGYGWVESFGRLVSEMVMVFVLVMQCELDNVIFNQLVQSGSYFWLYLVQDVVCMMEKLLWYIFFSVVLEQLKI